MKILAVNWMDLEHPQAGGAELHFFEIFKRLVARGHAVTLVCSNASLPASATIDGISVQRVGGRHTFALRARGAVRRALANAPYDVVVEDINKLPLFLTGVTDLPFYAIVPHLFGTTAFREASPPVAATVWLAERFIPSRYARAEFHAISDSTKRDLVARGVTPDRIRVIYPGVDASRYQPGGTRASEPTFLYVGRVKRYKGIGTAVRAVAAARDKGRLVRLLVAGTGDDRPRLERLVALLGVERLVTFLGFVSEEDKRRLMREAWAVVLPSAKEGWGLTNIEAAACGTPALAADRPGLVETVRDGETGYLFPHDDSEALASRFVELANDASLVARLGQAARRFAVSLSWDQAAEQTEAHLRYTIERVGGGANRE